MMRRLLSKDDGFSLVEIVVGAALALTGLALVGGFLINALNISVFAQGQAATLNDVRTVMQQIEKEVRSANSVVFCGPAGTCLEVGAQAIAHEPAAGATPEPLTIRPIRYTHVGTELLKQMYDFGTSTWSTPVTVIERVANTCVIADGDCTDVDEEPVFGCDTNSSLLKLTIDMHIEPTPKSNPTLNVQTSVRPRNYPSAATCP